MPSSVAATALRDLGGRGDALGVQAEGPRHLRVLAGDVGAGEALTGGGHDPVLHRHGGVVEQDRQDRDAGARAGLEVHARHADGGGAPHVDAQPLGLRELGAHRQAEAVAELGGLPPAQIAVGGHRPPERGQLVPRAARVVGDRGPLDVDGVQEVPDHAVGRQRRRGTGQEGSPLVEPRPVLRPDPPGHLLGTAAGTGEVVGHRLEQEVEGERGVPQQGVFGRDVLAQVAGVGGVVDEALPRGGEPDPERGRGETGPDTEHDVRVPHVLEHRARHGDPARAQGERVGLGERALPLDAGRHRRLEEFRELAQLSPRLRAVHTLARVEQRPVGVDQGAGRGLHRPGVGRRTRAARRRVGLQAGRRLVPDVRRDLDEHRTGAAVAGLGERAAQRGDEPGARRDLLGRLRHVPEVQRRVERGRDPCLGPGRSPRDDDERDALGVGLRNGAERVLDARPGLHAGHADGVAEPADGIRQVDADPLLPDDHRTDPQARRGLDERVQRVGG